MEKWRTFITLPGCIVHYFGSHYRTPSLRAVTWSCWTAWVWPTSFHFFWSFSLHSSHRSFLICPQPLMSSFLVVKLRCSDPFLFLSFSLSLTSSLNSVAITFSGLHAGIGLKSLNEFLYGKAYIARDHLTKDDVNVYAVVPEWSGSHFPNANKRYSSVSSHLAQRIPQKSYWGESRLPSYSCWSYSQWSEGGCSCRRWWRWPWSLWWWNRERGPLLHADWLMQVWSTRVNALFFSATRMRKAHEHYLKAPHLPFCMVTLAHGPIGTCSFLIFWYFNNFSNSSFSNTFHSSNNSKLSFSNNLS